jgi:hypothetical protein
MTTLETRLGVERLEDRAAPAVLSPGGAVTIPVEQVIPIEQFHVGRPSNG